MKTIKLHLSVIAQLIGMGKLTATLLAVVYIGITTASAALAVTLFAVAILLVTMIIINPNK